MLRREFGLALCSLALAPFAATGAGTARGPLFWLATRGKARVFIFGFGDAKDKSWFTPGIETAFRASSDLWLEVGRVEASDPAAKQADADLVRQLEHESGRTFFDALQPQVRQRTLTFIATLGIKPETIETLRPWRAFYVINGAYWSQHKLPYEEVRVASVLRELATAQGKSIQYEVPSSLDFAQHSAAMSDAAQSQYIEWLLDFLDEHSKGLDSQPFQWISGQPAANQRSLDRMRAMPDLYQAMQVQRNTWWAKKIGELLATDSTHFIGIGQLHILGPDGIPRQLLRLKVVAPSNLHENPAPRMIAV